jgi:hypothetical protein
VALSFWLISFSHKENNLRWGSPDKYSYKVAWLLLLADLLLSQREQFKVLSDESPFRVAWPLPVG